MLSRTKEFTFIVIQFAYVFIPQIFAKQPLYDRHWIMFKILQQTRHGPCPQAIYYTGEQKEIKYLNNCHSESATK